MPRQARLDAPGTLHHVILRGIEKKKIVDDRHGNLGRSSLSSQVKMDMLS